VRIRPSTGPRQRPTGRKKRKKKGKKKKKKRRPPSPIMRYSVPRSAGPVDPRLKKRGGRGEGERGGEKKGGKRKGCAHFDGNNTPVSRSGRFSASSGKEEREKGRKRKKKKMALRELYTISRKPSWRNVSNREEEGLRGEEKEAPRCWRFLFLTEPRERKEGGREERGKKGGREEKKEGDRGAAEIGFGRPKRRNSAERKRKKASAKSLRLIGGRRSNCSLAWGQRGGEKKGKRRACPSPKIPTDQEEKGGSTSLPTLRRRRWKNKKKGEGGGKKKKRGSPILCPC